MEKINIGKIVNAVGLKGEVKVYSYSNSKERYEDLTRIYVEKEEYKIEKVRYNKDVVILKLVDVDDRTTAESMKNKDIFIDESDLAELPDDEYYVRDMLGISVVTDDGRTLGILSDVIQNKAQDLYEVEMPDGRKILIPAVAEFILNVDIANKQMTVKLIEGLI